MTINRRDAVKTALLGGVAVAAPGTGAAIARPAAVRPVPLGWIDGAAPPSHLGQTVGVAWPRGALRKGAALSVSAGGGAVPSQHWTTATWPDGSIKWTAHAVPPGTAMEGLAVAPGRPAMPSQPVRVTERSDTITVRTGALTWEIARSGDVLIRGARQGDRPVLGPVTLVGAMRPSLDGAPAAFTGRIDNAVVESTGPIRAVIRLSGMHQGAGKSWLPFTVRLYAYAGTSHLRIVHSFIYDGDPAKDFLSAIGVQASVPMRGALHDRHLRLATDGAMFVEGVRPLTGLRRDPGEAFRAAQIAGRATPALASMAPAVRDKLERIPAWGDVSLEQPTAHGFTIVKRTEEGHAWVDSAQGSRAPGLAYVGGPEGGVAIAQRYFWQRHPSALHIRDAATDKAKLTAWMWSPEAPPMDLRPYRGVMGMEEFAAQNEGLDVTYEDYEPGWDSATGIARTSELTLWALPATPDTGTLQAMAAASAVPPQLMADPASLHTAEVLGIWNLPDRSTPNRAAIEDQLDHLVDFYAGEVDRRNWYGFWNHGDVMHSYDSDRHQWKYDIGGFAWANSELSPDLWLWYAALRSGKAQAFRLAEAMTRHTGEVDTYHLGRFKGMGTRHGVQHFSDSSKQPRVSNVAYRRLFYYLTADERVGDLMRDLLTSDETLTRVEIGRKVPSGPPAPTPAGTIDMGFGPSWTAMAGAWLTEWERTGDTKWRDRVANGMDSIGRMERGWLTGSAPFELKSGRYLDPGRKIRLSHLSAVFGAVEVNAELIQLIDVPRYRAAWLEYCRWYNAPRDQFVAKFGPPAGPRNLREGHSRLTAYAAQMEHDPALATRAASEFFSGEAGLGTWTNDPRRTVAGVMEWPGVSTNAASQWGLAAIQLLALVPDAIDRGTIPAWSEKGKSQQVS
ncbi:Tat pathway signal sequence domain protein [Sphingomonas mollis]|uniref:Tat pathway signal sequence domain protein n=1 Tax=Sphingomonas mollis TaxID=2795726 RepID=A0ABS0XKH5_9SPHN|nr:Tat pathway signal sequence domain protein [Sphingomonas sp. BT553]MBJ6120524.1 Tat pathway signal sequence domain protein [Sphingomonas sp. BT553]